ncbi:MAG: hypothetical protein K9N51_13735 [Candidatus Pacebacteria bacterium]|nr:hypothetical protein [Candidatus Paceibacterota bacterium]
MIAMALVSGCLPPTGAQHQQGVDLVKTLQANSDLITIIENDGVVLHGMYSAVIPPVVCLDIFASGQIDTVAAVGEIQKEMAVLSIDRVNARFYVGDLEQNRIYAQSKIRLDREARKGMSSNSATENGD